MKPNGKNERIKRDYFRYLKEAKRQSTVSVDAAAAAIDRFETYNKRRGFSSFHIEHAIGFKNHMTGQLNQKTKKPLSKATQLHTLSALRGFFVWLADQPSYRKRIRYSDADYFSLSLKDTAVAKAERDIEGPTIDQVRHVLANMPHGTDIERRNRALIAFTLLTSARDNAIASLRMKHVNIHNGEVMQDARDVRTKASKTIVTWFFPVGDDVRQIVVEWVLFLQCERQWGLDDALFPATRIARGSSGGFEAAGLSRSCWSNATGIRTVFRSAFAAAGLPYFNPHSFRKTLARLGEQVCTTPEQFKAWSQNLGHEKVLTTFTSYGQVDRRRQRDIMRELWEPKTASDDPAYVLFRHVIALSRPREALERSTTLASATPSNVAAPRVPQELGDHRVAILQIGCNAGEGPPQVVRACARPAGAGSVHFEKFAKPLLEAGVHRREWFREEGELAAWIEAGRPL
jgi:integrase/recombinase XerD